MRCLRETDGDAIPRADEEDPFPSLRYPIVRCIEQTKGDVVARPPQFSNDHFECGAQLLFLGQRPEPWSSLVKWPMLDCRGQDPFNVLHDEEPWLERTNHPEKFAEELSTLVG